MRFIFPSKSFGFSLVELVMMIILIGILTVVAWPRLFLRSSVDTYALRDEFIAKMREVQIMAMNNTNKCYQLRVTQSSYHVNQYNRNDNGLCGDKPQKGHVTPLPDKTYLSLVSKPTKTSFHLTFDSQGLVINKVCNNQANCIQVNGGDTLSIAIESQGYIHAG